MQYPPPTAEPQFLTFCHLMAMLSFVRCTGIRAETFNS